MKVEKKKRKKNPSIFLATTCLELIIKKFDDLKKKLKK